MAIQPYLKLYRPPLKGVCLEWFFPDERAASVEFANWMRANAPPRSDMFHQGGSNDLAGGWHFFEFWNFASHSEAVTALAYEAAKKWGKQLIIEL